MMTIDFSTLSTQEVNRLLLSAVIPRPIALASTIDRDGNVNLSPFSFFNVFGSNPPVVVFSPSSRVRDNTTKHTLENVREVAEVVIHIVDHALVQQTSLASTEYSKGVNEFVKAGLTAVSSHVVKPPRVKEAPIAMECKVLQIVPTGDQGGAGNLVVCEVLMMHVAERILNDRGSIDPFKLDAVARLGQDFYARIIPASVFAVPKPLQKLGIGFDQLPTHIKSSNVLTGNDLALLANVERVPDMLEHVVNNETVVEARAKGLDDLHTLAKQFIKQGKIAEAWSVLLSS